MVSYCQTAFHKSRISLHSHWHLNQLILSPTVHESGFFPINSWVMGISNHLKFCQYNGQKLMSYYFHLNLFINQVFVSYINFETCLTSLETPIRFLKWLYNFVLPSTTYEHSSYSTYSSTIGIVSLLANLVNV